MTTNTQMMGLFGFKKGNGEFILLPLTKIMLKSLEYHKIMMVNQHFNLQLIILRGLRFKMINN